MFTNKDISKQGYKANSPYRNNPYLLIKSQEGVITMDGVDKPLVVKDIKFNDTRILQPNSGNHSFKGDELLEVPLKEFNNVNKSVNKMLELKDKKLWGDVFNKAKLKMGGYAMPNDIHDAAMDNYIRKKGGFVINQKEYGKMLPFLEKEDGGNIEPARKEPSQFVYESVAAKMVAPSKDYNSKEITASEELTQMPTPETGFNQWLKSAVSDGFDKLPPRLQEELEFMRGENTDNIGIDFATKHIPDAVEYYNLSKKSMPREEEKGEPAKRDSNYTKAPATLKDMVTPAKEEFKKQSGGNIQKPVYEQGMRIKYRKGGNIMEGIVKSYDPSTGKINLY